MTSIRMATMRLFAVSALMAALGGAAYAQEACTTYAVKDGDTLASIAKTAYGTYDYQMIFNANRDALPGNPNKLTAGLELILPCKDGRLTADSKLNEVIAAETEKAAAKPKSNLYEPPLKFVSGNDWAPFAGEDLQNGGILVNLATSALKRGGNDREYTLAWVNDWDSHLESLLPSGAYDISIAWELPDCTKVDMLSQFMADRCANFDFSLPLYEVAEGFFTLADNKYVSAKKFTDFEGARICRPQGWGTADLEVEGLKPPFIEMIQAKDTASCAKAVLDGSADVFSIELETAIRAFTEQGAMDKVVQNPGLANMVTYHLVTSKTNPRGRIYIAMLNAGLTQMRESGEWYDVVASGLASYNSTKK